MPEAARAAREKVPRHAAPALAVRAVVLLLLVCWPVVASGRPAATRGNVPARHELRLATLLPDGSSWMKELRRFSRGLEQRSRGEIRLQLFGGAIMGDERDMVEKMGRGALDGAALTAAGLGLILSEIRVLELPFLFESDTEIDVVRGALTPELSEALLQRGYVLLGWADPGWVMILLTRPARTREDLGSIRMWSWTDDQLAGAFVKRFPVKSVPLAIQDVLPALQTGLIDACYASAFTTLAFQWHTQVRYFVRPPVTYSVGALVVTRRAFEALTPRQQALLREDALAMTRSLLQRARRDNEQARRRLRALGVEELVAAPQILSLLRQESQQVWAELAGRLYPRALLDRVLSLRDALRRSR